MEPGIEVMKPVQYSAPGVDKVEASALQLDRQLLDIRLDECGRRCALACDG